MNRHTHSGFELMRIVSMLMIISIHYLGYGGFLTKTIPNSWNWYFTWFLQCLVIVGVNCFVLLSGYFLVGVNKVSKIKVFKLWVQIFFYTILIFILNQILNIDYFSIKALFQSLLPIKFSTYWFATAYLGLYLLFPYFNIIAQRLSRHEYKQFLFILIVLFSLYSTGIDTFGVKQGYSLLWFVVLYFIGGYLKLYNVSVITKKKLLIYYLCITFGMFIFKLPFPIFEVFPKIHSMTSVLLAYNSPAVLFSSIVFFLIFEKIKICSNLLKSMINFFSPLTFGVYLISDNFLMRNLIWDKFIKTSTFYDSNYFLVHYVLAILGIFIVCSLIEKMRVILFNNMYVVFMNIDNKRKG